MGYENLGKHIISHLTLLGVKGLWGGGGEGSGSSNKAKQKVHCHKIFPLYLHPVSVPTPRLHKQGAWFTPP